MDIVSREKSVHTVDCKLSNSFLEETGPEALNTTTTEKAVSSVHIYQMCMSLGFKLGPVHTGQALYH